MKKMLMPTSKSHTHFLRPLSLVFGSIVVVGLLSGCANPSMQSAAAAVDGGIRSTLASMPQGVEKLREVETEANKVQGPEGKRITDTPLHQLFAKYPNDGTKPSPHFNGERWFPRVALIPVTVPAEHSRPYGSKPARQGNGVTYLQVNAVDKAPERMCWSYRAKIWDSATKSRDVPEFLYCMSEAQSLVRIGGAQPTTVFSSIWASKTQSGSLFTTGPRQPQKVASSKYIESADVHLRTYGYWNMMGVMTAMGIDPYDINEGNRVWFADNKFVQRDF